MFLCVLLNLKMNYSNKERHFNTILWEYIDNSIGFYYLPNMEKVVSYLYLYIKWKWVKMKMGKIKRNIFWFFCLSVYLCFRGRVKNGLRTMYVVIIHLILILGVNFSLSFHSHDHCTFVELWHWFHSSLHGKLVKNNSRLVLQFSAWGWE